MVRKEIWNLSLPLSQKRKMFISNNIEKKPKCLMSNLWEITEDDLQAKFAKIFLFINIL